MSGAPSKREQPDPTPPREARENRKRAERELPAQLSLTLDLSAELRENAEESTI